jgi:predicted transcriptional regulator
MTLALTPETEEMLREKARAAGRDVTQLGNELLNSAMHLDLFSDEEEVEAIREGLKACEEGRVRPLEEVLAEHRLRYPDSTR